MADRELPLVRATAADTDLRAEMHRIQAATLRGDVLEICRIRERAHALLDVCLDQHAEWATVLRVQLLSGG